MTIENQVVSLELAQKMKELGFEQESLFYWYLDKRGLEPYVIGPRHDYFNKTDYVSAYTVAELGKEIRKIEWKNLKIEWKNLKMKYTEEWDRLIWKLKFFEHSESEANNRAAILIYLKENNLI